MSSYTLVVGDCRVALAAMQQDSVDAIVTDPPYELGFMGKRWDRTGVAFDPATWVACYRVSKPGGRLLAFGAPRTAHRIWCAIEDAGFIIEDTVMWLFGSGFPKHRSKLKPAYEPICVARKGDVSELNIDAARIGKDGGCRGATRGPAGSVYGDGLNGAFAPRVPGLGRWPANVMLDEKAAALLDEQSGEFAGQVGGNNDPNGSMGYHGGARGRSVPSTPDFGGASRFFYTAKASRGERNFGLDGLPKRNGGSTAKGFVADVAAGNDRNRPVANHHTTVKPVELMRYLVQLVTPEGGTVLDPFCGSGSTGVACTLEGRAFIGIELDPEYAAIAERRIRQTQPSLFGGDA